MWKLGYLENIIPVNISQYYIQPEIERLMQNCKHAMIWLSTFVNKLGKKSIHLIWKELLRPIRFLLPEQSTNLVSKKNASFKKYMKKKNIYILQQTGKNVVSSEETKTELCNLHPKHTIPSMKHCGGSIMYSLCPWEDVRS